MDWIRHRRDEGEFYYKEQYFNGFKYLIEVGVYTTFKTEMYWFALSSGKKRKDLLVFEEKEKKSKGGIQALLWAKKEMLAFPEYFGNPFNKRRYICIRWADSRRRDIYQRLEREGFRFEMMWREKILIKKV